ncbi:MAG TPA: hypothetical protein VH144_03240 [Candidatus Saccharimonadales bacterium]|jgi:hypothetical protein|nr:hypothetical protein [Candidatus Saccharimonadales bacterium]
MPTKSNSNDTSTISESHKTRLRAQLLAHTDDLITKKKRLSWYWPMAAAIPVAALALLAVTTILPPHLKTANPIVQQAIAPLTAQKVFALASKQVDTQTLAAGQYYYTKTLEDDIYNNKDSSDPNACVHATEYREAYINASGITARMTRSDLNDRLFQLSTETENGRNAGPEWFSDQATADASQTPVPCPAAPAASLPIEPQNKASNLEELRKQPSYKVFTDIQSGNPSRQKEALDILGTQKGFTLTEHQLIAGYDKQVIGLSGGTGFNGQTYYFDQATKAYVGMDLNGRTHVVVLHQDIRALPTNDPAAYFRTTPMGR